MMIRAALVKCISGFGLGEMSYLTASFGVTCANKKPGRAPPQGRGRANCRLDAEY